MSKKLVRISFALFLVFIFSGISFAEESGPVPMGIVTGGPKGTYYQFGLNLEQLMAQNSIQAGCRQFKRIC